MILCTDEIAKEQLYIASNGCEGGGVYDCWDGGMSSGFIFGMLFAWARFIGAGIML